FELNEIRLPITEEDGQEFREIIADQEGNSRYYPSIPKSIEMSGSLWDHVQEKQKKKKKLSKPKPGQSSDLPEILTKGSCQNSSLDVLYDLIALIRKDRIEAEEAIHKSEKYLANDLPFGPLYLSK
ncbi:30599_t:CDS:2, partial [Racocetra persica]